MFSVMIKLNDKNNKIRYISISSYKMYKTDLRTRKFLHNLQFH